MGSLFWFPLMVETKRGYGLRRGHCFCLYLVVVVVAAAAVAAAAAAAAAVVVVVSSRGVVIRKPGNL